MSYSDREVFGDRPRDLGKRCSPRAGRRGQEVIGRAPHEVNLLDKDEKRIPLTKDLFIFTKGLRRNRAENNVEILQLVLHGKRKEKEEPTLEGVVPEKSISASREKDGQMTSRKKIFLRKSALSKRIGGASSSASELEVANSQKRAQGRKAKSAGAEREEEI